MINVWLPKKIKIMALGFQRGSDFIPIEKLLPIEIRELATLGYNFAVIFNNGRTFTLKEDKEYRRITVNEFIKYEDRLLASMAQKAAYFFLLRQDWLDLPHNSYVKNRLDMTDAGTYNNFNLGVSDEV